MAAFLPFSSRAMQQAGSSGCVLATPPPVGHIQPRAVQTHATKPSRRGAEAQAESYAREFRSPPPPPVVPPPPPPIFDNGSSATSQVCLIGVFEFGALCPHAVVSLALEHVGRWLSQLQTMNPVHQAPAQRSPPLHLACR